MPLKLSKLTKEIRTISFFILDEKVTLKYRVGALTPELLNWLRDTGNTRATGPEMAERLIVEWDITDDDGNVIPVTRDAIEEFNIPNPLLNAAFNAIYKDVEPDQLKKSNSGASSSRNTA